MESLMEIIANYFSYLIVATASILSAVSVTYFTLKGQLKRDEANRLYEQRKIAYKEFLRELRLTLDLGCELLNMNNQIQKHL